jgi:hypothetical protein
LGNGFGQATKFSSGPLRTSNATNGNKALGWYDNASASQVSVLYTFYGDANLDGAVNGLDFSALASNFGGASKFWYQGDFNYDGTVNSLDFNSIAGNFNQTMPVAAPNAALGALVPEPGTALLAALGAITVLRRRRRR